MPHPITDFAPCEFCTREQLCQADCGWPHCLEDVRSPPSPAGEAETMAALAAPAMEGNTLKPHRNYLAWLHVILFLGLDVEPRSRHQA